jgi:type II secretory pathway pseudopilin PulG
MNKSPSQGFTLIETMVLVAIATIALGMGLAVYTGYRHTIRKAALERDEAKDLHVLLDAAQRYSRQFPEIFPEATLVPVSVSELKSAGYLPANFAMRKGHARTPFGEQYQAWGYRSPSDQRIRLIATENQATAPNYARYGIPDTAIPGSKRAIAGSLTDTFGDVAGVWNMSGEIQGVGAAFTIAPFWLPPGSRIVPLALAGFPELDAEPGDNVTPPTEPPENTLKSCTLQQPLPTTPETPAQCPAEYTEVARFPHCGKNMVDPIFSTDYGTVTIGTMDVPRSNRPFQNPYWENEIYPTLCSGNRCLGPSLINARMEAFLDASRTIEHHKKILFNQAPIGIELCGIDEYHYIPSPRPDDKCHSTSFKSPPACLKKTRYEGSSDDLVCCK